MRQRRVRNAGYNQEAQPFGSDFDELVAASRPQPGEDIRPGLGNFPPAEDELRHLDRGFRANPDDFQRTPYPFDRHELEDRQPARRSRRDDYEDDRRPARREAREYDDRAEYEDDFEPEYEDDFDDRGVGAGARSRVEDDDGRPRSDRPSGPLDELRQQLLEQRRQMREENESLRRELWNMRNGGTGQPATPAAAAAGDQDPYATMGLPFQVNAEHLRAIREGDPEQAVELLNNMLTATARHTARQATSVLANAYQRVTETQQQNAALVQRFWRDHRELRPYESLVTSEAASVFNEFPHLDTATKMEKVAERVEDKLAAWNIDPFEDEPPEQFRREARERRRSGGQGQPRQRRRSAPAFEMGGSTGRPNQPLSRQQREMLQLVPDGGGLGFLH